MIYHIQYNENHHKLARAVNSREELLALRNDPENLANLALARQGDEAAKARLLQLAYNIGHVDGLLAGCKSQGSFFFHDVDSYEHSDSEALMATILEKRDEIGLVMLERSVSGGWHLVCRRLPGTTILENQVRVASLLQIEMDTNAKDLQRVVFSTSGSSEDLVYLDDVVFTEPMSPEACEAEYRLLRQREKKGLEQVPPEAKKANKHFKVSGLRFEVGGLKVGDLRFEVGGLASSEFDASAPKPQTSNLNPQTKEISNLKPQTSNPRVKYIFRACMKEEGVTESDLIDPGGRHNSVKMVLSCCNQLLTKEETLSMLRELMPDHWQDDNIQRLVNDFYTDYYNPSQRLTQFQKRIFRESRGAVGSLVTDGGTEEADRGSAESQSFDAAAPPAMPKKLPALISLLTSRTPQIYKAAVAHAVFPPLATHLKEVRFCYINNVEHEATLMNCLMAVTGAGKGCIDEPIKRIMADIRRRDEENERREAEWKKDCMKRGANKDKMQRPEGLVIQIVDPDMTKPALVTRMDEADGHFVYVKLNEIDLFDQLKGATGKQQFQLMCLAFDTDSEYGQTRYGAQSVTARPKCRFNWNACTTIRKGRKYFNRVLTDGPLSRINFCTIPEVEIGADMPIYGKYDLAFDEQLKPYIDNLVAARGLIDCPQALKLAKQMVQKCADVSRLSQDATYWELSHRAIVIAWLKACVLFVANGCQWERSISDFIMWSLDYDLWCKLQFFGEAIDRENAGSERVGTRGPRNLLELLPDVFTIDDARRMRLQQGKDAEHTGNMVSTWKKRLYVVQMADGSFQKKQFLNSKDQ